MIEYVAIGAAAIWGVRKLRRPEQKPKAKNTAKAPAIPCIIERYGRYWDGKAFSKQKAAAKSFKSSDAAWEFIDAEFAADVAEECNLEFRVK